MNKDLMRQAGFGKYVDAIDQGKCPFCGTVIGALSQFRDALFLREFKISGLCQRCQCQRCQDETFGVLEAP